MPFHGQKRFTPDNWFLTWIAEESDSERKSNGKRSLPSKEARGLRAIHKALLAPIDTA